MWVRMKDRLPVKAARAFSHTLVSLGLIHAAADESKLHIDSFHGEHALNVLYMMSVNTEVR